MRAPTAALSIIALIAGCPKQPPGGAAAPTLTYPEARRGDTVDSYFGVQVADPYRWMEQMDSDEVKAWIAAENGLTRQVLDAVGARPALAARVAQLWTFERWSLPQRAGDRLFYEYNDGTWDQPRLLMEDDPDEAPRLLVDPATFSPDGTVAVAGWHPSPDGTRLVVRIADAGSDWQTWRVIDTTTGETLPDEVKWVKFSDCAWTPDGQGFFYSRFPEPRGDAMQQSLAHQSLWYHRLGTPQRADVLIHRDEAHPNRGFSAEVSDDGKYLVMTGTEGTEEKNRVHVWPLAKLGLAADKPSVPAPLPVRDGFDAAWIFVGADGDTGLFLTDKDAPRYRLVSIDLRKPEAPAKELIPQAEDTLQRVSFVGGRLLAQYLHRAAAKVNVYALSGALERSLELPGLGSVSGFDGDADDQQTWFSFTSFTQPATLYTLDVTKGTSTVWHAPAVAYDPAAYVTEQVDVRSKDGTILPMFLTHHVDAAPTGDQPTLLYGYGGFNIPITPSFKVENLAWLEAGGVFAVANLRGGGEFGADWHEAGTKLHKQNVFDDFIASAEHLIQSGWTRPDRLAIHGRSNGGLLTAATLVQRPDLFGAAIPSVGVLDMLRYHRFTIGWAWASDYGTSGDDEAMFTALRAYSPVHNTRSARYPATLITTADHDDRVVPLHSYKFAAALQRAQQGPAPVLIRVETRAGHGAGTPVSLQVEEVADKLAFLVDALRFEPGPGTRPPVQAP